MSNHRVLYVWGLSVLLTSLCPAQVFEQWRDKYNNPAGGSDELGGVATDATGNYYVTGSEHHGIGFRERILLLKYSPQGRLLWRYLHAPVGYDQRGYAVTPNDEGGCYVSGVGTLLKINHAGQLVWARPIPGQGASVVATPTQVYVTSNSNADVWVAGFSSEGTLIWSDTYGFGNEDWGEQIQLDRVGDIVVTAVLNNGHSVHQKKVGVLKYAPTGDRKWARSISLSSYSDYGTATIDSINNIILAGSANHDGYTSSIFAMKLGSQGQILWTRISDHYVGREHASLGRCDAMGNVYLAASYQYGHVTAIKYSPDGDLLHSKRTGPQLYRVGTHASDENGNIYLPATVPGVRPSTVICKVANTGAIAWTMPLYERFYHHYPQAVLAPDESVYVSNMSTRGSGGWDILSAKFVQD